MNGTCHLGQTHLSLMEFTTGPCSRVLTCQMRNTVQGLLPVVQIDAQSWLTLCHHMDWSPARLLCPWDFPGKNTGVACHFLFKGIFLTQVSKLRLLSVLHWQADSLPLSHLGSPISRKCLVKSNLCASWCVGICFLKSYIVLLLPWDSSSPFFPRCAVEFLQKC